MYSEQNTDQWIPRDERSEKYLLFVGYLLCARSYPTCYMHYLTSPSKAALGGVLVFLYNDEKV